MSKIPQYAAQRNSNFLLLDEGEQHQAIRRLARSRMTDHDIAGITGLHVEQVRRIIGKRNGVCEGCGND